MYPTHHVPTPARPGMSAALTAVPSAACPPAGLVSVAQLLIAGHLPGQSS